MKICAIIPSYNHYKAIGAVVERLREEGLPVFIIDDGSAEPACSIIAALHNERGQVIVRRLELNKGKGGAVIEGFRQAIAAGFSHAVQIDADGQHDLNALPKFLDAMRASPAALISGKPVYDASIPKSRKIGRWITHVWVWIETLSFRISDSMCGFRIYPLTAVEKLLTEDKIGQHMDFDTDIMVRLFWRGVEPVMVPVKVIYPSENTSNFQQLHDNVRISKMHARLFLTMLVRLPQVLAHRPPKTSTTKHWADLGERGTYWGVRFLINAYRLLGRQVCQIVMLPVVFYFYCAGKRQREASHQFLARALKRPPTMAEGFRHHMNFALRALDVVIGWSGSMPADAVKATDPAGFAAIQDDPQGALFIVAHLGNVDVARAALDHKTQARVTVLVHTRHAENYNRALQKICPEAGTNMVEVTEIGAATIIDLQQRIERGEWIVIAGDRVSVLSEERRVFVPFFGQDAAFPEGPWILGALLECPVYLLFCLQDGKNYRLTMEPFSVKLQVPRSSREASLRDYIRQYAERLEHYAKMAPFQWYNFFDFWAP